MAVKLLHSRLVELDGISEEIKQRELVIGLLAGNFFDWGAYEVVKYVIALPLCQLNRNFSYISFSKSRIDGSTFLLIVFSMCLKLFLSNFMIYFTISFSKLFFL